MIPQTGAIILSTNVLAGAPTNIVHSPRLPRFVYPGPTIDDVYSGVYGTTSDPRPVGYLIRTLSIKTPISMSGTLEDQDGNILVNWTSDLAGRWDLLYPINVLPTIDPGIPAEGARAALVIRTDVNATPLQVQAYVSVVSLTTSFSWAIRNAPLADYTLPGPLVLPSLTFTQLWGMPLNAIPSDDLLQPWGFAISQPANPPADPPIFRYYTFTPALVGSVWTPDPTWFNDVALARPAFPTHFIVVIPPSGNWNILKSRYNHEGAMIPFAANVHITP